MKKTLVLVGLFLGLCATGFAQQRDGQRGGRPEHKERGGKEMKNPEERATKMADKMKEELGLSEQQYNDVLKLNADRQAKMQAKHEEHAEARKEMQEGRKAENEAYLSDLEKILSPEQLAKFKTQMDARKGEMDKRMEKGPEKKGMKQKGRRG